MAIRLPFRKKQPQILLQVDYIRLTHYDMPISSHPDSRGICCSIFDPPIIRTNPTIELLDQVTLLILRKVENFPIRPDGEMVSRQISASCCSKNRHHISEDCGFESHFGRVFFCSFACSTRYFFGSPTERTLCDSVGYLTWPNEVAVENQLF
jgi:hypothetical protein